MLQRQQLKGNYRAATIGCPISIFKIFDDFKSAKRGGTRKPTKSLPSKIAEAAAAAVISFLASGAFLQFSLEATNPQFCLFLVWLLHPAAHFLCLKVTFKVFSPPPPVPVRVKDEPTKNKNTKFVNVLRTLYFTASLSFSCFYSQNHLVQNVPKPNNYRK